MSDIRAKRTCACVSDRAVCAHSEGRAGEERSLRATRSAARLHEQKPHFRPDGNTLDPNRNLGRDPEPKPEPGAERRHLQQRVWISDTPEK